ncbi:SAM-dependent methyltransferase [Streptomyces sp. DSM 44917]|uniref:SAM-dependent methyltransferase n=1 Tax=Streptomyces boetiae TaxID=3075541 RepID=A0ABU2LAU6_9ACTN|nr:SAM-dependent methyltransferase [Streptomyces sp. DSM 44917]MDT0308701.1 SAM-dependent methyltransferase [Streptomyces sp. DSM 44917]
MNDASEATHVQDPGEEGFSAEQIDTSRPHPARMYDYWLGGQDNYEVDRRAADGVAALLPDIYPAARENRGFLHRAVRAVTRRGIRQIIDVGTGIPTSPNTHEVARAVDPGVRVAYVDNDPIVSAYAGAKLTSTGNAAFALADVRDPRAILGHPAVAGLIDFGQPVALLLVALLHFVPDEADPGGLVAALTEPLPPGSCVVISHGTTDFHDAERLAAVEKVYEGAAATLTLRPRERILDFFQGWDLLEPGLVQPPFWRPEKPVPDDPVLRGLGFWSGVAVRP